jgi:pimeloyl-ACP methyl ester carboxylesterase
VQDSRRVLTAALATIALAGCSHGSGSSGGGSPSTTAPASTSNQPAAVAAPLVLPVVCVHGITADPVDFVPFQGLYGPGRAIVPALYAAEADQLKPGDLPLASVVSAGYYQESVNDPKYDPDANGISHGAMGGCPSPRTDPWAPDYTVSYVERLARIIDGVRRATGSDRVDLVLHSMGNLVGRSYARWHSSGALGGVSKVRRLFELAGPHRGINAIEAYSLGFTRLKPQDFMRQGEIAEMCYEYPVWQGQSMIEQLNDGWDTFCAANDVHYGGMSAVGAYGKQVDPAGSTTVTTIATVVVNIVTAVISSNTIADLDPFYKTFKTKILPEAAEALGPGDGVVRLASSRLDQAPFARTDFWLEFQGRHEGTWNTEQAIYSSTVTSELARQYLQEGVVTHAVPVTDFHVLAMNAPGHATWIALETDVGADTAGAQLVEVVLDAKGNPVGGATGYGCPVAQGKQRTFFQVPAGAGVRHYHAVLYGAGGVVATEDVNLTLVNGALDEPPATDFVSATTTLQGGWPAVHATFGSNVSPSEPTLAFSYRLDNGPWTPYSQSSSFDTPTLGPGEHRLVARAQHAANGAGFLCQDARGVAIGLLVSATGGVTVRR